MNGSKRRGMLVLATFLLLSVSVQTLHAAQVEIEWFEPEKYRDIEAGADNQQRFQQRVTTALESYFKDAAAAMLPADQTLRLTITDVDLAGDMEYFFFRFPQGIRVLRDIYFPAIEFDYTLVDDKGNVLRSGKENIKDMGYLFSGMVYIRNPPFDYEKRMIEDWFRKNFK